MRLPELEDDLVVRLPAFHNLVAMRAKCIEPSRGLPWTVADVRDKRARFLGRLQTRQRNCSRQVVVCPMEIVRYARARAPEPTLACRRKK